MNFLTKKKFWTAFFFLNASCRFYFYKLLSADLSFYKMLLKTSGFDKKSYKIKPVGSNFNKMIFVTAKFHNVNPTIFNKFFFTKKRFVVAI